MTSSMLLLFFLDRVQVAARSILNVGRRVGHGVVDGVARLVRIDAVGWLLLLTGHLFEEALRELGGLRQ